MYPKARINPSGIPPMIAGMGSKMKFTNGEIPYFTYYFDKEEVKNSESYLGCISTVVNEIGKLKEEEK